MNLMEYSNTGAAASAALEHLSEETIDLHACGRLYGEALDTAEDHLLICAHCRARQHEADVFFKTLMESPVARQERSEVEAKIAARARRISAGWWLVPVLAMLVVYLGWPLADRGRPAEVTLLAMRGAGGSLTAPANRPLVLRLDLTGLAAQGKLRAEIVDEAGRLQQKLAVDNIGGQLVGRANAAPAGLYWVRLYDGDRFVREYKLERQR